MKNPLILPIVIFANPFDGTRHGVLLKLTCEKRLESLTLQNENLVTFHLVFFQSS